VELEAECEEAEDDGALYAMKESKWEKVDENVRLLEEALTELNRIQQEKYYQQRVATAQSGSRRAKAATQK